MLKQLSIQNFALIDKISIEFDHGLSVITGETGAGKSILLGALSLILGNRADHDSLKDKSQKCIVEGVFDISEYKLKDFFEREELDYSDLSILRREISPQGKSRNFINDTPTTLDVMKLLGNQLIDIHSQHQSLQINDSLFQLEIIDALAGNQGDLKEYQSKYAAYKQLSKELELSKAEALEAKKQEDYINFQFNELAELSLKPAELLKLEEEQERFANSEEIISKLSQLTAGLSQGENNVLDQIAQLKLLLSQTSRFDKGLEDSSQRLNSMHIEMADLARELEEKAENFEHDPKRFQIVEERLGEIHRLQIKHNLTDAEDLIPLQQKLEQELLSISNFDDRILEMEKLQNQYREELKSRAEILRKNRVQAMTKISESVEDTLQQLGMPYARLKLVHELRTTFNNFGLDDFNFLFTANKGMEPQIIAKTASGGEISRLMLAIKKLLAQYKYLPTILFDEIDTGVSGEVANKMGSILNQIGQQRQVISITHLPQLAAKGKSHFFVYKEDEGARSITQMKKLTDEERVEELAKMLSGSKLSEAARINAKELLSQ